MNLRSTDEIPKVELNFTVKDKDGNEKEFSFIPEYRAPSMAVQDAILPIREKLMAELQKQDDKYADLVGIDSAELSKDKKNLKRAFDNMVEIPIIQFKWNIEFFKKIVSEKQRTTDERDLLNKPVTDQFWKEQDLVQISAAVNSFRELIKI
jgi:hypothetical protein